MKLRLIAGTINHRPPEAGWLNVHLDVSPRPLHLSIPDADPPVGILVLPDVVADLAATEFRHALHDGMFDEVRLHHVLEHVARARAAAALANLRWCLRAGGILDVEVPDFDRVARAWLADDLTDPELEQWVYGEELGVHEPGDSHRSAWTERILREHLEAAGFRAGAREQTGLALRFRAIAEGQSGG